MLQPVGFPAERVTLGMVQDPVQHCSGKYWIPHHLSPVNDLFVGGKDDGTGFIGVTDKCEKAVCLSAAYRCIAVNILVREYRCSGGTDTANPAAGNRCSGTEIPHLIDCLLPASLLA